jgi:ornithine--oxo-acid transaminase
LTTRSSGSKRSAKLIELAEHFGAHNYHPLPVVLTRGRGIFVWDVEGKRYFDMLSAYSALNQGHVHPKIATAARRQLGRLTLTSRAFHNELMGPLLERLCKLAGMDRAILMNSGAEAVETAIKAMRLWGYRKKGIPDGRAEIIVCENNFHGRTTTIVGFSSDPLSTDGFGPATPGFKIIPYGDAAALRAAIGPNTCGFLVEPIQGEAGVNVPPRGYLREVRAICSAQNVLWAADEIQTGLGRTGRMFCVDHEGAKPDLLILGKALSGGFYPVSAVLSREDVLGLYAPGTHGSTFGGNPLACAIAQASLDVLEDERLADKAEKMGAYFMERLQGLDHPALRGIRGRGLLIGVEFSGAARPLCEALMKRGLLAKDTHEKTLRLAPPLVITKPQIDAALKILAAALKEFVL